MTNDFNPILAIPETLPPLSRRAFCSECERHPSRARCVRRHARRSGRARRRHRGRSRASASRDDGSGDGDPPRRPIRTMPLPVDGRRP